MSARRRSAGSTNRQSAERPWGVFLTDRRKAGAPLRLAAPFPKLVTDDEAEALTFATEEEAAAWCESSPKADVYSRYVKTPGRVR